MSLQRAAVLGTNNTDVYQVTRKHRAAERRIFGSGKYPQVVESDSEFVAVITVCQTACIVQRRADELIQ